MVHPFRALWIVVIASPVLSYSITSTFIADFIQFQRQAGRPSTVRAFVCWKEGTGLTSLEFALPSFPTTPQWLEITAESYGYVVLPA